MVILSILIVLATFTLIIFSMYRGRADSGGIGRGVGSILLNLSKAITIVAKSNETVFNRYMTELNYSLYRNNGILIADYGFVSRNNSTYLYIIYVVGDSKLMYMGRLD